MSYIGIKFTATKAGHVLGACMYTIEIEGIKVLYTGDYSMDEDRYTCTFMFVNVSRKHEIYLYLEIYKSFRF